MLSKLEIPQIRFHPEHKQDMLPANVFFVLISQNFIFSFLGVFTLRLLAKRIDFVLIYSQLSNYKHF